MILTMTASTPTLKRTLNLHQSPNPATSSPNPKETFSTPPQSELKQKAIAENASSVQTNLNDHLSESGNYVNTEKAAIEEANKTQQQADEQIGESPIGNK